MTIKELKEIIKDLDDDMEIGGTGHFGEFLQCYDAEVTTVSGFTFLNISIESAGEDPDLDTYSFT